MPVIMFHQSVSKSPETRILGNHFVLVSDEMPRGHGGRVVTLSPPTSEAGVRSPHGLKWESW